MSSGASELQKILSRQIELGEFDAAKGTVFDLGRHLKGSEFEEILLSHVMRDCERKVVRSIIADIPKRYRNEAVLKALDSLIQLGEEGKARMLVEALFSAL